jgi:transaldolase
MFMREPAPADIYETDQQLHELGESIWLNLALEDISAASDLFRPI